MGWKSVLLTAAVAALFGFAGAELGLHNSVPPQPPAKVTLGDTINQLLDRDLNLTAAQKTAIGGINARYTRQRNQLLSNLYIARAQLGGAFSENMSLSEPTKEAISNMQLIVGDLQTLTISYIVDIRNQLTASQRQVYDQKVVEMLMRDTP
jgi:hypothetical protein